MCQALCDADDALRALRLSPDVLNRSWTRAVAKALFIEARSDAALASGRASVYLGALGDTARLTVHVPCSLQRRQGKCALQLGDARAACTFLWEANTVQPDDTAVLDKLREAVRADNVLLGS